MKVTKTNAAGKFTVELTDDELQALRAHARQHPEGQRIAVADVIEAQIGSLVQRAQRVQAERQVEALLKASPASKAAALQAIGYTEEQEPEQGQ